MSEVLQLLALSTLLPKDVADRVLAGESSLHEVVSALVIHNLDCDGLVRADSTSTWNEVRIARACAVVAFLSALMIEPNR